LPCTSVQLACVIGIAGRDIAREAAELLAAMATGLAVMNI
jgi:hypothetical protein